MRKPRVKPEKALRSQSLCKAKLNDAAVGKTNEPVSSDATGGKEYHILSLSGGKDSTALAFFIKENMPDIFKKMEMVFCDTECELPETYEYLNKIEVFLGKKIHKIQTGRNFDHLFSIYRNLPAPHRRWCTIEMKTKPFRKYIFDLINERGEGIINLYVGIRGDEAHRAKPSNYQGDFIKQIYPFVENCINKKDVENILNNAGIGFPEYYKWSGRSGCYFCFYQPKISWVRLSENYPELFKKAMDYEIDDGVNKIGWNMDMLLRELILPESVEQIKAKHELLQEKKKSRSKTATKLVNIFSDDEVFEEDCAENGCIFCHL